MGNRAVIKGKGSDLGVYVHWNGGYDSVYAFTQYCKLKGYRSPEQDDYGVARLCQVIGNFFGGSDSVGIWNMSHDKIMSETKVASFELDNGVYELENWEIVAHWNDKLVTQEHHEGYELNDMLISIDESMPVEEQLGKDFIFAEVVEPKNLNVGDKIYLQHFNGKYYIHTVLGFAEQGEFHNGDVSGLPYVDLYDHDSDWRWNGNNYIKSKTIRRKKADSNE